MKGVQEKEPFAPKREKIRRAVSDFGENVPE
jgi:hypothetical protein